MLNLWYMMISVGQEGDTYGIVLWPCGIVALCKSSLWCRVICIVELVVLGVICIMVFLKNR